MFRRTGLTLAFNTVTGQRYNAKSITKSQFGTQECDVRFAGISCCILRLFQPHFLKLIEFDLTGIHGKMPGNIFRAA